MSWGDLGSVCQRMSLVRSTSATSQNFAVDIFSAVVHVHIWAVPWTLMHKWISFACGQRALLGRIYPSYWQEIAPHQPQVPIIYAFDSIL